jgi:hypothetical protein
MSRRLRTPEVKETSDVESKHGWQYHADAWRYAVEEGEELVCPTCGVIDKNDVLHGSDKVFHCLRCDAVVPLLTSERPLHGTSAVGWAPLGGPAVSSDRMMNGTRLPRVRPMRGHHRPRIASDAPVSEKSKAHPAHEERIAEWREHFSDESAKQCDAGQHSWRSLSNKRGVYAGAKCGYCGTTR